MDKKMDNDQLALFGKRKYPVRFLGISLILSLGLFGLAKNSWAATSFYVIPADDITCVNNGDGTAAICASDNGGTQPGYWRGFSNVRWGSGAGEVGAGDTLYLVGGKTYKETLTIGASGISGNPITISVNGSGAAVIDAENTRSVAIKNNEKNYITIDGIRGNAYAGDTNYGIRIINVPGAITGGYCVYENCGGGIGNKYLHIECSGTDNSCGGEPCPGVDNDQAAMYFCSSVVPLEVAYSWMHGPSAGDSDPTQRWVHTGIRTGGSSGGTDFTSILIHHNRIENLMMDGIYITAGGNASIYNNDISRCYHPGMHADYTPVQSTGYIKIFNNYYHDDAGQQTYFCSTRGPFWFFNNLIVGGPHSSALADIGDVRNYDCTDMYFINNTWDYTNSTAYVIRGSGGSSVGPYHAYNLRFINNIWPTGGGGNNTIAFYDSDYLQDADSLDFNRYMVPAGNNLVTWMDGSNKTLAELRALTPPREINGDTCTPVFESRFSDYQLQSTDTCVKSRGANLSGFCSLIPELCYDKNGTVRPSIGTWDVGAYEYGPSGDKTPPATPSGLTVR